MKKLKSLKEMHDFLSSKTLAIGEGRGEGDIGEDENQHIFFENNDGDFLELSYKMDEKSMVFTLEMNKFDLSNHLLLHYFIIEKYLVYFTDNYYLDKGLEVVKLMDKNNQELLQHEFLSPSSENDSQDNSEYAEKLKDTKSFYPFDRWRNAFIEFNITSLTEENCNSTQQIFDDLIKELINIGENANEQTKVALFEKAVIALNELDDVECLIETGEREDLCELIDRVTMASGLEPGNYANGCGLADLWRDW